VTIHWNSGLHTGLRLSRVRCGRYPENRYPSLVEVIRKLGDRWPDRDVAVKINRTRCRPSDGKSWTRRCACANDGSDWGSLRSIRRQIGSRGSSSTKRQAEWESASAPSKNSSAKGCLSDNPAPALGAVAGFGGGSRQRRRRNQESAKSSDAVRDITECFKMVRPSSRRACERKSALCHATPRCGHRPTTECRGAAGQHHRQLASVAGAHLFRLRSDRLAFLPASGTVARERAGIGDRRSIASTNVHYITSTED
jgi:hypothetical protein